jgi:hypothetical protein
VRPRGPGNEDGVKGTKLLIIFVFQTFSEKLFLRVSACVGVE